MMTELVDELATAKTLCDIMDRVGKAFNKTCVEIQRLEAHRLYLKKMEEENPQAIVGRVKVDLDLMIDAFHEVMTILIDMKKELEAKG